MKRRFSSVPLRLAALFWLILAWLPAAQAAPRIQHWETVNGLRVYFVQAPELPMVDLRLVFDAGSARDGANSGLARLVNGLLDKGAGALDADAVAARFEGVGARYGAGVGRDMAWVSLRSLSDPELLEPALETFVTVVGDPRFPARDFERARRQTFVALRAAAQDPGAIAEKAFYAAVYGDHPYARPTLGAEESIKGLTREDLQAFYRRYYVARNAVLAVVGDVNRTRAERLAERIARALAPGEPAPALPPVPALTGPKTVRIAFPSEQAHVLMGQPGMRRGDPDYFPLYVGNHVLGGGGFTSRLMKAIRTERGLSYSVYSYFLPMAVEGPFQLGFQTKLDQAEEAVRIARETVRGFVAEGPRDEELEASKDNITGGFPLRTASNGAIVQYIAMIGFYGLPLDYLDSFTDKVRAVDAEAVRDAFRRRLDPGNMVTVIVGGPAAGE